MTKVSLKRKKSLTKPEIIKKPVTVSLKEQILTRLGSIKDIENFDTMDNRLISPKENSLSPVPEEPKITKKTNASAQFDCKPKGTPINVATFNLDMKNFIMNKSLDTKNEQPSPNKTNPKKEEINEFYIQFSFGSEKKLSNDQKNETEKNTENNLNQDKKIQGPIALDTQSKCYKNFASLNETVYNVILENNKNLLSSNENRKSANIELENNINLSNFEASQAEIFYQKEKINNERKKKLHEINYLSKDTTSEIENNTTERQDTFKFLSYTDNNQSNPSQNLFEGAFSGEYEACTDLFSNHYLALNSVSNINLFDTLKIKTSEEKEVLSDIQNTYGNLKIQKKETPMFCMKASYSDEKEKILNKNLAIKENFNEEKDLLTLD